MGILSLVLFLSTGENVKAQKIDSVKYSGSIVYWKVPACVFSITIEAKGAQGGDGSTPSANPGGLGADMKGTFNVTPGDILGIIAGQKPVHLNGGASGGGGGSFVWDTTVHDSLFVAAGGGGGSCTYFNNPPDGLPGDVADSGTMGTQDGSGHLIIGGRNGNGGNAIWEGSGGAGWLSNGTNGTGNCSATFGGIRPLAGGQGGTGTAGNGGFGGGGGGGSCWYSAGGGGGYSGGSGSGGNEGGGGGGGSFNSGTSQTNAVRADTGNGLVILTYSKDTASGVITNVVSPVSCNGGSNAKAVALASGSSASYTYSWAPSGGSQDTASGLSAGTYTVTVNAACGGTFTASVTITQPTVISIAKSSTPDNGSSNGTAKVTVSGGVGPYTYLWSPGGSTIDSIMNEMHGTYCCTVHDAHGCFDSVCVDIAGPAGVDNISSNTEAVTIYPNPNNGNFQLKMANGLQIANSQIEIYNMLGEKVYTKNVNAANTQVELANKPNGIYMYRILSETGTLISEGKFVIQQ